MVKMGQVWDQTLEFLNEHLGRVMPFAIVAFVLPSTLTSALSSAQGNTLVIGYGLAALISIAAWLLQTWGQLAITVLVLGLAGTAGAGRTALRRLPPAIAVMIVLLLGAFALSLPAVLMLRAGGMTLSNLTPGAMMPQIPASISLAVGLYGVLYLLVLLFFTARVLSVLFPIVVAERHGVRAIGEGFRLTRGHTWRLIGVVLLYAIVTFVATRAAQLVFGSVLRLVSDGQGPLSLANVITALAVATVASAFSVIATVFCAKLYQALTARIGSAPLAPTPA
jgi:hypothetical protein